jgi:hypothetical protein
LGKTWREYFMRTVAGGSVSVGEGEDSIAGFGRSTHHQMKSSRRFSRTLQDQQVF